MTWGNMEIHHQLDTMVGVSIYQWRAPKWPFTSELEVVPFETNHEKSKKTNSLYCASVWALQVCSNRINNSKGNPEKQQHSDIWTNKIRKTNPLSIIKAGIMWMINLPKTNGWSNYNKHQPVISAVGLVTHESTAPTIQI